MAPPPRPEHLPSHRQGVLKVESFRKTPPVSPPFPFLLFGRGLLLDGSGARSQKHPLRVFPRGLRFPPESRVLWESKASFFGPLPSPVRLVSTPSFPFPFDRQIEQSRASPFFAYGRNPSSPLTSFLFLSSRHSLFIHEGSSSPPNLLGRPLSFYWYFRFSFIGFYHPWKAICRPPLSSKNRPTQ